MSQKVSYNLEQKLLQGYDLQMVQNVHLLGGVLFADYVVDYCRENTSLRLKGYQDTSYDIDYSMLTKEISLFEHLSFQIETGFMLEDKEEALNIARGLDSNGFYDGEESSVLQKIWYLDPVGIGTRSPREAMLIQLKEQNKEGTVAYKILASHYKLFLQKNISTLSKKISVTENAIKDAITTIVSLHPFPGRGFMNHDVHYIFPEMIITYKGSWKLSFVKEYYPSCEIIKGKDSKQMSAAKKFIYQLHQRKNRLEWIVSQIIKKQHSFLLGEGEKQQLHRKDLLKELNISESMLSRILSEKYIETPIGIFPLSYFFTRKSTGLDVDNSVEKAKKILQILIDKENKSHPHPDQLLSDLMKQEGVLCSRRSIAKYRKSLNILPTHHRRN